MNKFIVCLDHETTEEANAFIAYLKTTNLGWWHRTSNSWAITSNKPLTGPQLRDTVIIYFPNRNTLIIDMQTKSWCGWGLTTEFEWFDTSWK